MAKTTNILDLNNRLTKVEKENVAQNSYTSLKNKPKINGVTLTGNKSLADIGAAAATDLTILAGDVGDKTNLTTTYKDDLVGAINEVNGDISAIDSLKGNKLTTQLFSVPGVEVNPGYTSDYTFNITKTGYTALGVVGFYIGAGSTTSIVSVRLTGANSAGVRIINSGSAAFTPNDINIIVLYVKNDPT